MAELKRQFFQKQARRVEELMRNSGLNSLDYVEQFSYLLFLKFLSDILYLGDDSRQGEQLQSYWRYSTWATREASDLPRFVSQDLFPRLASSGIGYAHIDTGVQAIFNNAYLLVRDGPLLKQIIAIIGEISFQIPQSSLDLGNFMIREAYDLLIDDLAGENMQLFGPFYTPQFLTNLIVNIAEPRPDETLYDPAFGTGGILATAGNFIKEQSQRSSRQLADSYSIKRLPIYGREINFRIFKLGLMRIVFHGIDAEGLRKGDSLSRDAQTDPQPDYQVVLTNMLFEGASTSTTNRAEFPVRTRDFAALFLQHVTGCLANGGRAVVVVPEGLLFRGDTEREVRRHILELFELEAVLSLPHGVFAPYTSGKASILVIRNSGKPTKNTWFYEFGNQEIERLRKPALATTDNEITNLYKSIRLRTARNSRSIAIEEIISTDFALNASRYLSQSEDIIYPQVTLDTVLQLIEDKSRFSTEANQPFLRLSVNTHHQGVDLRGVISSNDLRTKSSKTERYRQVRAGQVVVDPVNFSRGGLGVAPPEYDKGLVPSRYFVYDIFSSNIKPEFLDFCLRSQRLLDELAASVRGTSGRLRFSSRAILSVKIPVPSLEVQNEYVDRLNARRKISLDAFRLLKTLDEVGESIDPATFGSYKRIKLEEVTDSMQGGLSTSGTRDEGDLRLIRVRNIQNGTLNLADSVFVDRKVVREDSHLLRAGDLLFIRVHGSREDIGRCVVFDLQGDYVCSSNIVRVRLNQEKANPHFVSLYFNSPLGRREVMSRSRATVQYSINHDDISSLWLLLPSLEEQNAILSRVDRQRFTRQQITSTLQELTEESNRVIEEIMTELHR